MADTQRIEVGNAKFSSITENKIMIPKNQFDFSSEEITFDETFRTFDETPI